MSEELTEGRHLGNEACPDCGSRDNLSVYLKVDEDGSEYTDGHCWGRCGNDGYKSPKKMREFGYDVGYVPTYKPGAERDPEEDAATIAEIQTYGFRGWKERRIKKSTYERYESPCEVNPESGDPVWYNYPVTEDRQVTGYKKRYFKKITNNGKTRRPQSNVGHVKMKSCELFGQKQFESGGKFLIITEGEEDAMAYYQALYDLSGGRYQTPSVSVMFGAGNAAAHVKTNYEWVTSFTKVLVAFDNDEAGRNASEEVLKLLRPGQGYKVTYTEHKDASDYLKAGKMTALKSLFWEAEKFSPAGIVGSSDTFKAMVERASFEKIPLPPFARQLEEMLNGGFALGEITTLAAASSTGKTSITNEWLYHFTKNCPYKVGIISLESDVGELTENLMSLQISKKLANMDDEEKLEFYASEEAAEAHKALTKNVDGTDKYYILDHQGSVVDGELMSKIEYMVKGLGCKVIVLDPLTLALSGEKNEGMDLFMSDLLRFVKREKIHHINVAHVRKNSSGTKANSTGAEIHEEDVKGCTDYATEFLTPSGWKRIGEYAGEKVAQYEDGVLSFVNPDAFVNLECNEDMYHFTNKTSVDMLLSGEHRMLLGGKVRLAEDVALSIGRAEVPCKFRTQGLTPCTEENRIRLMVACAADACYHGNGLAKAEFRKQRKVERFKELLDKTSTPYSSTVDSDGDTTYRFKALTERKRLHECANWYQASSDALAVLVDECVFWDGTTNKRTGEEVYYTSLKEEADVVQFAAHACGRISHIRETNKYYAVSIAKEDGVKNKVMLRGDTVGVQKVPSPDGRKYCFKVPSGFFLARRNGRVFVTGNSGSIFQVSMNNILLMRDKESSDPLVRNTTKVVMSKARRTGNTGPAGFWFYDNETSRLSEGRDPHGDFCQDVDTFGELGAFEEEDPEEFVKEQIDY